MINAKINVLKIPKDKLFAGEKGTYLDCKIVKRKEPDQFGNTHTIYIQKSKDDEKIYIGDGKEVSFDQPKPADTGMNGYGNDLPF
jgi:hypothetical protein